MRRFPSFFQAVLFVVFFLTPIQPGESSAIVESGRNHVVSSSIPLSPVQSGLIERMDKFSSIFSICCECCIASFSSFKDDFANVLIYLENLPPEHPSGELQADPVVLSFQRMASSAARSPVVLKSPIVIAMLTDCRAARFISGEDMHAIHLAKSNVNQEALRLAERSIAEIKVSW